MLAKCEVNFKLHSRGSTQLKPSPEQWSWNWRWEIKGLRFNYFCFWTSKCTHGKVLILHTCAHIPNLRQSWVYRTEVKKWGKAAETAVVPCVFYSGTRRLWALLTEDDPSRKEGKKRTWEMPGCSLIPTIACVCMCVSSWTNVCACMCTCVWSLEVNVGSFLQEPTSLFFFF